MRNSKIGEAEYGQALARGRADATTEVRAGAVRYLADRDVLETETTRDGRFIIPRARVGVLQNVSPDELERLEVWPAGSAIELQARDIQISVDGLLSAVSFSS